MALIIRKTEEGTRLEGDPPENHVFSVRHIERELQTGLIEVFVGVKTDDGPHFYQIQGFEPIVNEETGESTPNFSAWVGTRVEGSIDG